MPIFEYRCSACEFEFEREQRIYAKPIRKCPQCDKAKVNRLISNVHFSLKGGGWANDGYSKPKKENQ